MNKKMVVFSFDDGRKDNYTNAYRIMKKHGLVGTMNITTSFVDGTCKFADYYKVPMSTDQVKELAAAGFEIASHGDRHMNSVEDISISIDKLQNWGILKENEPVGFASPGSWIDADNIVDLKSLVDEKRLLYVRTGTKIRREEKHKIMLHNLNKFVKSKRVFFYLNRDNIVKAKKENFLIKSIVIYSFTTLKEIQHFLLKMPNGACAILMLHSILKPIDPGYGTDKYCFDADRFDALCWFLTNNHYQILTTRDALRILGD